MAERHDNLKVEKTDKPEKDSAPIVVDTDKSFADRDHGRTHDSAKTKRTPRTL